MSVSLYFIFFYFAQTPQILHLAETECVNIVGSKIRMDDHTLRRKECGRTTIDLAVHIMVNAHLEPVRSIQMNHRGTRSSPSSQERRHACVLQHYIVRDHPP